MVAFIVIGLIAVGMISYSAGLTREVKTRDCGFFASCEKGHAKEKIEVTKFDIANAGTVIGSLVGTLLIIIMLTMVTRTTVSKAHGIVIGSAWLIGLMVVLVVVANAGSAQNGHTMLIGALTDEEYSCQQKAVRSLDSLAEPPSSCPSSPLSEAYFRLDK